MKFDIIRVSNYGADKQPCEEAKKYKGLRGYDDEYEVEVKTLEELLALIDREGQIIVEPYGDDEHPYQIEIYDDYRE